MNRRGFTLMEVLVVLAIIGMIMAGSFVATTSLNEERTLREPMNELRMMAKRAWQRSLQEQRAWQIRIAPNAIYLEPRQAALEEDRKMFQTADQEMGRRSGVEVYKMNPEVRPEIRHWGEEQWITPRPDIWVFEHSGICEPIAVRFISPYGVLSAQFDPLTASAVSETLEALP